MIGLIGTLLGPVIGGVKDYVMSEQDIKKAEKQNRARLPFLWALFDPVAVEVYFTLALGAMPEWYIQLYGAMVGGVWGISALKNTAPGLIGGIVKAVKK